MLDFNQDGKFDQFDMAVLNDAERHRDRVPCGRKILLVVATVLIILAILSFCISAKVAFSPPEGGYYAHRDQLGKPQTGEKDSKHILAPDYYVPR